MKLAFLVSGNGGNLKFINMCILKGLIDGVELVVIADRECGALQYAKNNNIECYQVLYSKKENKELLKLLDRLNLDVIITNIHKILDEEIVKKYYGKLINLHYSLLPSFAGLIGENPINNAMEISKFIGVTVHYVDIEVDSGEFIIQGLTKNIGKKDEIINKIFRIGCVSLLYAISKNKPYIMSSNLVGYYEEKDLIFSPALNYNANILNEKFWGEVKSSE